MVIYIKSKVQACLQDPTFMKINNNNNNKFLLKKIKFKTEAVSDCQITKILHNNCMLMKIHLIIIQALYFKIAMKVIFNMKKTIYSTLNF